MKTMLAVMLLALSGCATTIPKVVKIPISAECPAPPATVRPHLTISDLKPGASPDEVVRAYAESVETLGGYAEELEITLEGYRK